MIVEALVLSVVRYCLSVYGSCGVTQRDRVQKIVNFCARVVTGKRRFDHISGEIQRLRWLKVEQLIVYHTVCALASVIVTQQPEYLCGTIGPRSSQRHTYRTRQADLFSRPNIRTESGRRRMCYRGVTLLNGIGADLGWNVVLVSLDYFHTVYPHYNVYLYFPIPVFLAYLITGVAFRFLKQRFPLSSLVTIGMIGVNISVTLMVLTSLLTR